MSPKGRWSNAVGERGGRGTTKTFDHFLVVRENDIVQGCSVSREQFCCVHVCPHFVQHLPFENFHFAWITAHVRFSR